LTIGPWERDPDEVTNVRGDWGDRWMTDCRGCLDLESGAAATRSFTMQCTETAQAGRICERRRISWEGTILRQIWLAEIVNHKGHHRSPRDLAHPKSYTHRGYCCKSDGCIANGTPSPSVRVSFDVHSLWNLAYHVVGRTTFAICGLQ